MDQALKCLLDVDGVLCDFAEGAAQIHGKENPYLHKKNHGIYEMEGLLGLTSIEFMEPMGLDFWASLRPTKDAHLIVRLLENHFGAENICLLTKPVPTPGCQEGKLIWIRHHFPQFLGRYLIGPSKTFCAHPGAVLIDDHEKNVDSFIAAGGQAFLMPAHWNYKSELDRLVALADYLETL